MQKLLIVTSRVPWPLDKGDKLRAFHQIKAMSRVAEVYLFCTNDLSEIEGAESELKKYCKEVRIVPLPKLRIVWNLFLALFQRIPFQVAYFYNRSVQRAFDDFANRINADTVYCQLIRTALIAKKRHEYKVVDYMDTFSKGIERRLKKSSGIKNLLLRMEHSRLIQFERDVFSWFDERLIISEQDRNLIPHSEKSDIKVIPNGVDLEFFRPQERIKEFEILFSGNMNYPPNIEAAEFLCSKIIPLLSESGHRVKVLISGTTPASKVKALESPNITVSGWVNDIRENYARSRVLVAPMQSSIGLQNKLLEAMAMGIPCVTSTLANNALGAKAGEEILTADTPEEYVAHIIKLLSEENEYQKFSNSGLNFVRSNFSWEKFNQELADILLNSVSIRQQKTTGELS